MHANAIYRTLTAAGAALFALAPAVAWAGPTLYTLTDLGTLGGTNSYAWSINNSGQITGFSDGTGTDPLGGPDVHAFLYKTSMTDLGTLPGDSDSVGLAINASGNIAGYAAPEGGANGVTSGGVHAILINPTTSTITDLGTLDNGGPNLSYGYGINDSNAVVGYSFENFDVPEAPFIYGSYIAPFGIDGEYVLAVNNATIGVGSAQVYYNNSDEPDVAAYYDDDTTATLFGPSSATDGTPYSYGTAINNASGGAQITGYVDYSRSGSGYEGDSQAFLYDMTGGSFTTLGIPIGSDTSRGYGLNNNGIVVGTAYEYYTARNGVGLNNPTNYEFWRAAIFESGSSYYLDDLLTGASADGYFLNSAMSINDSGDIVGFATTPGGTAYHAVLLTPTTGSPSAPPPASLMKATDVPGSGISLTWTDNSGGRAYTNIEVNSGSGFTSIGLLQPGTTTLTDSSVNPGTAYTFEAIAVNSVGSASPSNTSTATYTVPAPSITSISPASTPVDKTVKITVLGKNFVSGDTVQISGTSLTTTYKSATKLTAMVLAAQIKTPAKYPITVVSPPNAGGTSNSVNLKATGPLLAVTVGTMTRTTVLTLPIKVSNSGNVPAAAVTITSAVLGTAATTSTLPIVLGTIADPGNASTTLLFPTSAGGSGKTRDLVVKGSYTGGTFTSTVVLVLP